MYEKMTIFPYKTLGASKPEVRVSLDLGAFNFQYMVRYFLETQLLFAKLSGNKLHKQTLTDCLDLINEAKKIAQAVTRGEIDVGLKAKKEKSAFLALLDKNTVYLEKYWDTFYDDFKQVIGE